MIPIIVSTNDPITLIGAGPCSLRNVRESVDATGALVAADGGAKTALAAGLYPQIVIGDLDSLDAATRYALDPNCVHPVTEQDNTDFEKALLRIDAPVIVGVGFLGGRIDHELAVFHALLRFSHKHIVLISEQDVMFMCPPQVTLPMEKRERVSLFPLQPVTGTSEGLKWPIDELKLQAGYQIATSNEASEHSITLRADRPGLLVILKRSRWRQVMQALLQFAQEPWPPRVPE